MPVRYNNTETSFDGKLTEDIVNAKETEAKQETEVVADTSFSESEHSESEGAFDDEINVMRDNQVSEKMETIEKAESGELKDYTVETETNVKEEGNTKIVEVAHIEKAEFVEDEQPNEVNEIAKVRAETEIAEAERRRNQAAEDAEDAANEKYLAQEKAATLADQAEQVTTIKETVLAEKEAAHDAARMARGEALMRSEEEAAAKAEEEERLAEIEETQAKLEALALERDAAKAKASEEGQKRAEAERLAAEQEEAKKNAEEEAKIKMEEEIRVTKERNLAKVKAAVENAREAGDIAQMKIEEENRLKIELERLTAEASQKEDVEETLKERAEAQRKELEAECLAAEKRIAALEAKLQATVEQKKTIITEVEEVFTKKENTDNRLKEAAAAREEAVRLAEIAKEEAREIAGDEAEEMLQGKMTVSKHVEVEKDGETEVVEDKKKTFLFW